MDPEEFEWGACDKHVTGHTTYNSARLSHSLDLSLSRAHVLICDEASSRPTCLTMYHDVSHITMSLLSYFLPCPLTKPSPGVWSATARREHRLCDSLQGRVHVYVTDPLRDV